MAYTTKKTFNLLTGSYLTLANEEMVRPFVFGSNWLTVRIGLLVAFTAPNTQGNMFNGRLAVGVCSGLTGPFNGSSAPNFTGSTTTNFMGYCTGDVANGGTWTYAAGTNNMRPYFTSPASNTPMTRVGTTNTTTTPVTGGTYAAIGGVTQRRTPYIIQIEKGITSSTNTLRYWSLANASQDADFMPSDLLNGLEQSGTAITLRGIAFTLASSTLVGTSDVNGPLDSLNIFWSKRQYPMELHLAAVYRVL